MKCNYCGDDVKIGCDWRQGRCPHRPVTDYHFRFYNLLQFIKGLFKGKQNGN